MQGRAVHRREPLVAEGERSVAREPGERAFYDPAVSIQPVLLFDSPMRDSVLDPAPATRAPSAARVGGTVRSSRVVLLEYRARIESVEPIHLDQCLAWRAHVKSGCP